MSKSKYIGWIALGLLLANLMLSVYILNDRKQGPPRFHKQPKEIIIRKLKFDPSQVEAYELLIHDHRKSVRAKEEEMKDTKDQLYRILKNDTINLAERDSLMTSIGQIQEEMEHIHFRHLMEIK